MKRFIVLIMSIVLLAGCGLVKQVPIVNERVVIQKDTIIQRIDSVQIQLEREYIEVIKPDSSHLETKYAISDAKIDINGNLSHILQNKQVQIPVQVITKEVIHYKDSIQIKHVPIEVEKKVYPKSYWYLLGIVVLLFVFVISKFF